MALIGEEKAPVPGEKKKKKGNIDMSSWIIQSYLCSFFQTQGKQYEPNTKSEGIENVISVASLSNCDQH